MVHGIAPDSALFSELRNAAARKEIAALLDSETPVAHELLRRAVVRTSDNRAQKLQSAAEVRAMAESAVATLRQVIEDADEALLHELEETFADLFSQLRHSRRSS